MMVKSGQSISYVQNHDKRCFQPSPEHPSWRRILWVGMKLPAVSWVTVSHGCQPKGVNPRVRNQVPMRSPTKCCDGCPLSPILPGWRKQGRNSALLTRSSVLVEDAKGSIIGWPPPQPPSPTSEKHGQNARGCTRAASP